MDKKPFKQQMTIDTPTVVSGDSNAQKVRSNLQSLADIEDDPFAEEAGGDPEETDSKKHSEIGAADELTLQASIKEMKVTVGATKRGSSVSSDTNLDKNEMDGSRPDRLGSLTETGVAKGQRSGSDELVNETQGGTGSESTHRTKTRTSTSSATGLKICLLIVETFFDSFSSFL